MRMNNCLLAVSLMMASATAIGESVSKHEDYLNVDWWEREYEIGESVSEIVYDSTCVDSGSSYTVSVSGLPKGLEFDSKRGKIYGKTTKRGIYYVKLSAKNANGFSMSGTAIWNVAEATSNGDYDNIGLDDEAEYNLGDLETMVVGQSFYSSGFDVTSVSGLPSGIKWVKKVVYPSSGDEEPYYETGVIKGTPTKAGKYVITFTKGKLKTRKTIIVKDAACKYQVVGIGGDYIGRGKVTGAGVKRPGSTVTLTAKANKGYYFAGWYTNGECSEPFNEGKSKNYRTAGETFTLRTDSPQVYAKFVTKSEDATIAFGAESQWLVDTEADTDETDFSINSITKPSITAKTLPAGIGLSRVVNDEDAIVRYRLYVSDKSKLKPGYHTVTLTAKNLSGATATHKITIQVPNIQSEIFSDLRYDNPYVFTQGESSDCIVLPEFGYEEGWTIKASGLPEGLKFHASSGSADINGVASKSGTYTVTLTATKGKQQKKATFTVKVDPFPSAFVGSYAGSVLYTDDCGGECELVYEEEGEEDEGSSADMGSVSDIIGTFSLSIASNGKSSVKYNAYGKSVSMSGYPCVYSESKIVIALTSGYNECYLEVVPSDDAFSYEVSGSVTTALGTWDVRAQRNVAKTDAQMKKMVSKLAKLGAIKGYAHGGYIDCVNCVCTASGKSPTPNVTFTVDASGKVKAAGKIAGRKLSGSAQLQVVSSEGSYYLFADFCDTSKSKALLYRAIIYWDDEYPPTSAKYALYGGEYQELSTYSVISAD